MGSAEAKSRRTHETVKTRSHTPNPGPDAGPTHRSTIHHTPDGREQVPALAGAGSESPEPASAVSPVQALLQSEFGGSDRKEHASSTDAAAETPPEASSRCEDDKAADSHESAEALDAADELFARLHDGNPAAHDTHALIAADSHNAATGSVGIGGGQGVSCGVEHDSTR